MAVLWTEAEKPVLDLARRVIAQHHPKLADARIIFVMRSEAPASNGKVTYGKAKKLSAEMQVHIYADFIIWFALNEWLGLTAVQREALMDHELCHCQWDGLAASIRPHDAEVMIPNIVRFGFWWPQASTFESAVKLAIQQPLPLPPSPDEPKREGSVGTIDFGKIAREVAEGMTGEGVEMEYIPAAGSRNDE